MKTGLRGVARNSCVLRASRTIPGNTLLHENELQKMCHSQRPCNYIPCLLKRAFGTSAGKVCEKDRICELAASNIRYGVGATSEVGIDLRELGARRVLLVTDFNIRRLPPMERLLNSMYRNDIEVTIYDSVRVEPNDESFRDAIKFTKECTDASGPFDALVALGGGSSIDTAKVMNLYSCYPPENGDFYDYVNSPLGKGLPVPGPLLPLIAIPTTAGTGSETTGIAIFDDTATKSKTGIGHRRLRPTLGVVDPDNTATLPSEVAKYSGLDVLCHALESYTALPFTERPKPPSPLHRPAYQGSNPISDIWSIHALRTCVKYLQRAVNDPDDIEARSNMLLASTSAGIGFGNAGVQLCHGMSYPISSQVKEYCPQSGYENVDHALVPHGHSVIVAAPSVFRFTGRACPERHLLCAQIMASARGQTIEKNLTGDDAGKVLSDEILELLYQLRVPVGLKSLGYTNGDIDQLVKGTLPQHRVTKLCPRPVGEEELQALFNEAM